MAEMANNGQIFDKISNDMSKGPFWKRLFRRIWQKFQIRGFINIQIVDLYDLAKGSLGELVNLSEICQGGGKHAHKIVEMLPTYW